MTGIDKYITKDGSKFYLDLSEWQHESDIPIENGDTIKFSYDSKKYIAKVIILGSSNFGVHELSILKEL